MIVWLDFCLFCFGGLVLIFGKETGIFISTRVAFSPGLREALGLEHSQECSFPSPYSSPDLQWALVIPCIIFIHLTHNPWLSYAFCGPFLTRGDCF